jgi:hypothetical protein
MTMAMRSVLMTLAFLCGCASTVDATDAGGAGLADAGFDDDAPPGPCVAGRCPTGQACCLDTNECYRPAQEAASCPRPPQDADARRRCASHAQCAAGELCVGDNPALCLGPGHCQSRGNCGTCFGPRCAVCGCDGRDYASVQAACGAGVRITDWGSGGCGAGTTVDGGDPALTRISCGSDRHCPDDLRCCAVTGTCTDPNCAACCRRPPAGTSFPCVTNAHCQEGEYCVGEGCGTPGGCRPVENRSRCTGESEPVCGCDGRNYLNRCWAAVSGSRTAASGACGR